MGAFQICSGYAMTMKGSGRHSQIVFATDNCPLCDVQQQFRELEEELLDERSKNLKLEKQLNNGGSSEARKTI